MDPPTRRVLAAPAPFTLRDRSIEAATRRGLAGESAPLAAAIDMAVADGRVTLTGTLPSVRHRRWAEEIARVVVGVEAVDNQIRVEPVVVADNVIAQNVREALAEASPILTLTRDLAVQVAAGTVTLTGTVTSHGARRLAEDAAGDVVGVADVISRVRVGQATEGLSDSELRSAIEQRFAGLAPSAAASVRVSVRQGQATLSGDVGTFALRRTLAELAWVPGIRAVETAGLRVAWRTPGEAEPDRAVAELLAGSGDRHPRAAGAGA